MATPRKVDGLVFEVDGSGPPLLLLHTGIATRRMWDPQWPGLCRRFTAIRFDARGFGGSDDPAQGFHPHEDARTVLEAAGFASALVMGVSMGGADALDLAIAHPECVRALVAVSTTPGGTEPPPEFAQEYARIEELVEAGDLEAANEAEMRAWVDGPGQPPDRVDHAVRTWLWQENLELLRRHAGLGLEAGSLDPPASARLQEVSAPTLVVTGALDQPLVLNGSRALAEATGAKRVEFEDAAHFPNLERPGDFAAAVLPFLEEHAGAS